MSKLSDKIQMEKQEMKSSYDKTKMASDIIECFKLYNDGKLSNTAINSILEKYSWYYTEHEDNGHGQYVSAKYKGCKYWTEDALNAYDQNDFKNLRHEHIIPRSIFIDSMWKHKNDIELNKLDRAMSDKLKACVVTRTEAKKIDKDGCKKSMPKHQSADFFEIRDPWARYKGKGVKVYEVEWEYKSRRWTDTKRTLVMY